MEYVESALVVGRSRFGILVARGAAQRAAHHRVLLSLEMGIAVIVEAILSFVNLSIPTDDPTWGGMIAEGRTQIHFRALGAGRADDRAVSSPSSASASSAKG
jgi:dipeptide transport system permease protein